jgi:hypothetical protein
VSWKSGEAHPQEERAEGVIDVNEGFARKLNILVANGARRWIFHHPDDRPLDDVPFNPNASTKAQAAGSEG